MRFSRACSAVASARPAAFFSQTRGCFLFVSSFFDLLRLPRKLCLFSPASGARRPSYKSDDPRVRQSERGKPQVTYHLLASIFRHTSRDRMREKRDKREGTDLTLALTLLCAHPRVLVCNRYSWPNTRQKTRLIHREKAAQGRVFSSVGSFFSLRVEQKKRRRRDTARSSCPGSECVCPAALAVPFRSRGSASSLAASSAFSHVALSSRDAPHLFFLSTDRTGLVVH